MLIGVMLNCILFGIMVMQIFTYYRTYPSDKLGLKIFVAYLAVAEAVNTACDMYLVYQPLIQQYGLPQATTYFPITVAASPVVTVLISTPVQLFMAWRIIVITQSKKIPFLIAVFSIVSFAGGIWATVQFVIAKFFYQKSTFALEFNLSRVIWFVGGAVTDIIITITLVYSLRRRKTVLRQTSSIINRISKLTIQTGLVTTITALLDLFLFTLAPRTALNFTWDFIVSKLYTNALLSTLNARAGLNHLDDQAGEENILFGSTSTNSNGINASVSIASVGTFQSASRETTTLAGCYDSDKLKPRHGDVTIDVESQIHHDTSFDDSFAHRESQAL